MGQAQETLVLRAVVVLLGALWLILVTSSVFAALHWTFTPPVAREDDTPLSNDEIAHYEIVLDGVLQDYTLPGYKSDITIADLYNGEHCIVLRTVDIGGRVSRDSNTSCKIEDNGIVVIPPPALPPQIPADNWTVVAWTSYEADNWLMPPRCAFDRGTPCTDQGDIWHSQYTPIEAQPPHELWIDMGAVYDVAAFQQQPRADAGNGTVKDYSLQLSMDKLTWTQVAGGAFPPGFAVHTIEFPEMRARYFKFTALSEQDGGNQAAVDELYMLGTLVSQQAKPLPPTVVE